MIKLLKCEYLKTRRRYIFLTLLAVTAMALVWTLNGRVTEDTRRLGWMIYLYQLPVLDSVIMPLMAMLAASRLWDIEHRGGMLRRLVPVSGRNELYDAKVIYGLSMLIPCLVIDWAGVIVFGFVNGFQGDFPLRLYLTRLLCALLPTVTIFLLQNALSMAFRNQAVPFAVGITGTFVGMFSMFLPRLPWLRRLTVWGGYGALSFVGMYGYTAETRWRDVFFTVDEPDPFAAIFLTLAALAAYSMGKRLFKLKEV